MADSEGRGHEMKGSDEGRRKERGGEAMSQPSISAVHLGQVVNTQCLCHKAV